MEYRIGEEQLLRAYVHDNPSISVPAIVVEGPHSSGKSYTVAKSLEGIDHLLVECDFLMTRRRVLQKVLGYLYKKLGVDGKENLARYESHCENLSNFVYSLKRALSDATPKKREAVLTHTTVFVMDRIDLMNAASEQPGELCAGLARLHEQSPLFSGLTFEFVVNRWDYLDLATMCLPTVQFPAYTSGEVKDILGHIVTSSVSDEIPGMKTFVRQYVEYMVETYGSYFGGNMEMIMPVLRKLWPIFYDPVRKVGQVRPKENDVLTTFTRNKALLQTELGLVDRLEDTDRSVIDEAADAAAGSMASSSSGNYDLSTRTKYLIIASYLASYTDSKHDLMHFSRNRAVRSNRKVRYRRKKTGEKKDVRLLSPQPFTLERMLAILRAIYEEFDVREGLENDVELMNEVATLASLKTLVKLSANDTIGGGTKWRTNVQWDVAKKFADDIGFQIENYLE